MMMGAAKSRPGDAGERLFERYLSEQGYDWEKEPDLSATKQPDYLVRSGELFVVCEVKTFNVPGPFRSGSGVMVGARSLAQVLKPHRHDIRDAASQLKGLSDRGWPLVVVLSNPLGCVLPTDPQFIASAMYGDPELSALVLDDGSLGDFSMHAGRNGKLTVDDQYISAVAMLRQQSNVTAWGKQWVADNQSGYQDVGALVTAFLEAAQNEAPQGDEVSLDIIETISEKAVPLPRSIFRGPRDRRFALNSDGTAIAELTF